VLFAASSKAKYLSITIKPDRTVRVAIPKGVSLPAATKFLKSKTSWAKRHLDTLQMLQQNRAQGSLPALGTTGAGPQAPWGGVLSARLNQLAGKYGFTYNRLFIRNQRTRWGTCSSRNNISLNINLLKLPQELQDYVMLHELAHTKHKNHSREFWAEMDRLVGDAKKLRKQMRSYKL
jgi:predicted metal-dependent hydrolase